MGKIKTPLLSTDAHRGILSAAGLCDNKHLIRTLLQDVFYLQISLVEYSLIHRHTRGGVVAKYKHVKVYV